MKDQYDKFLKQAQKTIPGSLMELFQISFKNAGDDFLIASMPVLPKFFQPFGLLHGGALGVLAETVASAASFMIVSPEKADVRGMSIHLNHLASTKSGILFAKATSIHIGKITHLWDIQIYNNKKTICVGRQTNIILKKKCNVKK